MTNIIRSSEGTDVNIRKLGDAKALEDFGQARQADALTNEFHILPTVEKPIAGSHEPRGTYKYGGLLQESAAGRGEGGERGRLESSTAALRNLAGPTLHPNQKTGPPGDPPANKPHQKRPLRTPQTPPQSSL